MKSNKTILATSASVLVLGLGSYLFYSKNQNTPPTNNPDTSSGSSVTYRNADYGFTFSLPEDWKGYSIVQATWHGTTHGATAGTYIPSNETGPTLSIRNPNWTPAVHYEDMPIFIFTIAQWNSYLAFNFSIDAAPVLASELARNNEYVFALPSHWEIEGSKGYKEAVDILTTKPLHSFHL